MEGSAKKRRICENDGIARGASCSHTSTEGHGSTISKGHDYEVFLSFRGPDTRAGFTDFLYTSLTDAGIRAFKDDEDLRIGEEFAPELLQAINQSKISIPIFSKGYASSVWCLKELVQMIECKKSGGQKIMPIFYDVAPSEVRHQTEGYGEAFHSHKKKKRYDEETMSQWKAVLEEVSSLNGWDLHSMPNRREGEFTKKLTEKVFRELKKAYLEVSDRLVSVDNHVDAIMERVGAQTSETRIIGIHGMGGIGKATIAKIIYNQLSNNFTDCCFLSNVREMSERKGIECLQNQLISDILKNKCSDIRTIDEGIKFIKDRLSNKRVLLLLDDVHEKNHIDALVGERNWFGKGSKIIITTRNKEVLDVHEVVDCNYEISLMDPNQSLQLFSKHAFRRDSPLDGYIDLANKAIGIAGGLPLALEVIASLLSRTKKEKWDRTLKKLECVPHETIQTKLKISYEALDARRRHIFLDIACLFIGYDKDIVVHFWDESKYPEEAMEVLQNMSLIKITEDNKVWMHDQLKDLGREIVRQESEMKIEKQSRVWDPKEGLDLLRKHKGNKAVEALRLKLADRLLYHLTYEGFESLSNLRFLEVEDSWIVDFLMEERLLWHESPSNVLPANVFEENSNLLPQLRWLSWHYIPLTFEITHFSLEDMVFLDLSHSGITHNWKGWSHMKVMKNLKVLNLSDCYHLQRTPNFFAHPNLERLILSDCDKLVEIDGSICQLKHLVFLDVCGCGSLKRLPDEIGNLESLIELNIARTNIKELPDSIGNLKNLRILRMKGTEIRTLNVLWTMENLEEIIIDTREIMHAGRPLVSIDSCIHRNQSLKILKLDNFKICAVPKLPESLVTLYLDSLHMDTFPDLSNLTNLEELELRFKPRDSDGEYRESGGPLEERWMGNLSEPESVDLRSPHLKERLPSSLSSLPLEGCSSLCLMADLSNLKNLSSLSISGASIEEIQGIGCLENLRDLKLWGLKQLQILPDLRNLNRLRSLEVWSCDNLVEIQGELPQSLQILSIKGELLCSMEDLSNLKNLSSLSIRHTAIEEIPGLSRLENLLDLGLWGLEQMKILPDLSNLNNLKILNVLCCANLVEIQGELPQSLQILRIYSCKSLRKLPDLSSLMGKPFFDIQDCSKSIEEAIRRFVQINPRN